MRVARASRWTWGRGLLAASVSTVVLGFAASVAADADSAVGRWRTYDDRTHQPRGIVRIFEKDGQLFGRIENAVDKKDDGSICTACGDERKDQPINGLVIIRHMTRDPGAVPEWSGGDVIDPDDGKIYRFRMRLEDGGARLVVRGYIGFSLLGRSQTWVRMP